MKVLPIPPLPEPLVQVKAWCCQATSIPGPDVCCHMMSPGHNELSPFVLSILYKIISKGSYPSYWQFWNFNHFEPLLFFMFTLHCSYIFGDVLEFLFLLKSVSWHSCCLWMIHISRLILLPLLRDADTHWWAYNFHSFSWTFSFDNRNTSDAKHPIVKLAM